MNVKVSKDNYGQWRWVAIESGEARFSGGPYLERDDAVASAQSDTEGMHVEHFFVDGISGEDSTLPLPPKIDVVAEAAAAGLTPGTQTPEMKEAADKVRAELIEKQRDAEKQLAERTHQAELKENKPDALIEEPKDNPVLAQRKKANKTLKE